MFAFTGEIKVGLFNNFVLRMTIVCIYTVVCNTTVLDDN